MPIHALGIQSHINVGESWGKGLRELIDGAQASASRSTSPNSTSTTRTVKETDVAAIDRIVAGVYTDYLSVALESKAVKSVLTWGLTDAHTWLAGFMRPHVTDDKQPPRPPQRPLPFDPDLKPPPVFFAMRDAIDKAPHR